MSPAPLSPWTSHPFDSRQRFNIELGSLTLRLARRGNDLLVLESRETSGKETTEDKEDTFRRYAFEHAVEAVEVMPRTPARPLVVRPRQPLVLAPGSKVTFFVSFPVDVVLSIVALGSKTELERLAAEILSDTWFGDSMEGVLCFGLKSRARRTGEELVSRPTSRAICPLHIRNDALEPLKCEKFCLRLEHCKLWTDESGLWTSPIHVRFRGPTELSAIDYHDGPPEGRTGAHLLTEAEKPPLRGLIRRTFAFTGLPSLGW